MDERNLTQERILAWENDYQEKMNELIRANADLDNLLLTAQIGALFVDSDFVIRKITPIITKNTALRLADTGKNITEVVFMEEYPTFVEDYFTSVKEKRVITHNVERNGYVWGIRICPYYNSLGDIDGTIVMLFDVTKVLAAVKSEMQTLVESVPGGVVRMRYDDGLHVEYANDMFYNLLHMDKKKFEKEYSGFYDRFIHKRDWQYVKAEIEKCGQTGDRLQMEYRVEFEGEEEWRMLQSIVLEYGERIILQCVVVDITESKKTELKLRQERKKLNIIAMMSSDLLFEYDVKRDLMTYTRQNDDVINAEPFRENYVERIRKSAYFHPEDSKKLDEFCDCLKSGKPRFIIEIRKLYRDGKFHWVEIEGITIFNEKGLPDKIVGKTLNIDDRKERERIFREKAEKDSLTGLLNHRVTRDKINERIQNIKQGQESFLFVADIDNFKKVNDLNGHLFGDAVICTFADKMQSVFPEAIKGRIGGDEFMMLVEGISRNELEEKLAILQGEFQEIYLDGESGMKISCSCGVVVCDAEHKEAEKMFQWADYALYQVKRQGKGSFMVVEATGGAVPSNGYLNQRGIDEDYSRKDTLVQNEEELLLYTLELLENVADIRNGLKMVSDRICQFFKFDDVVYIRRAEGIHDVMYHWNNQLKKQKKHSVVTEDINDWNYIDNHCDSKGIMVLRHREMEKMRGEKVGSIMFVQAKGFGDYSGYISFVDRQNDRDWQEEKDALYRLANIIFNRLMQMYKSEEQTRQVEQQINYDTITKLPQYFKFIEMAEQYVKDNLKHKFFFVYSDFSNFQYLNEVYGFSEGDKVLFEYAKELQENCKNGIYHSRVTSDHFISLLSGTDMESVEAEFLRVSQNFCDRINADYEHCNLCIISGLCEMNEDYATVSFAVDGANIARKRGKGAVESTVVVYSDQMKSQNDEEKTLVARMVEALDNREFTAYIQPKISMETGKIIGGEALVRWIRQDGSMIYPDKFIPVFEKNGFITKIDFAVLEQVLIYLREAVELGEEVVPISVNFSRKHNDELSFTKRIEEYLQRYNTPRGMLEAEVTESVFMMDLTALKENISKLHDLGVTISIDDFGSGYSSLNVLANVSADIIKLDRKFFDFTNDQKRNKEFIHSLIGMMKQMGLTTVMEGVETKEQLEFIKECGCDIVQGYYYAKPMPLTEFRRFLKEFNSQQA